MTKSGLLNPGPEQTDNYQEQTDTDQDSLHKMPNFRLLREHMSERHISARGVRDPRVLAALRAVPREAFVPPQLAAHAYDDKPPPIDRGQTISQPYIVALMIEALQLTGSERVLDIGTRSGYAAAVLSRIAAAVYEVLREARFVPLIGAEGWPPGNARAAYSEE
jgi:hypothetical protein